MAAITENDEVSLYVSLRRFGEASNWDLVMDFPGWLAAHFAFSSRENARDLSRCFPSATASVASIPTIPSWMCLAAMMDGLPFGHAQVIAKYIFGMKVTGRSYNFRGTPRTSPRDFVCWLASLITALVVAIKRAVDSINTFECLEVIAARWACFLNRPNFIFKARHTIIVTYIEIEEKYCAIAVERLRQAVLPL